MEFEKDPEASAYAKKFYCTSCKGTTTNSHVCENPSCPDMPCCDKPRSVCICNTSFNWISTSEKKPLCYITGDWDGKQSDIVVGETKSGKKFLGICYEGFMDGSEFFDWYGINQASDSEWSISEEVVRWFPLPY